MTPEQAVLELIGEIRTERIAAEARHIELMNELAGTKELIAQLSQEFQAFRDHVLENEDREGRHLRMVARHAGVIDPRDRNGGE